jgi:hypothetical protein
MGILKDELLVLNEAHAIIAINIFSILALPCRYKIELLS